MNPLIRRPEEILAFRSLQQILGVKPWALWTIGPTDNVLAALQIMADRNIGFLVVLDAGKLVGVLSERDCARRVMLARLSPEVTPVGKVMVRDVVTVDLSRTFGDCLKLMHQHGIRHLPVMESGKAVAVVSVRHLMSEAIEHHKRIILELEQERMTIFTSTA